MFVWNKETDFSFPEVIEQEKLCRWSYGSILPLQGENLGLTSQKKLSSEIKKEKLGSGDIA